MKYDRRRFKPVTAAVEQLVVITVLLIASFFANLGDLHPFFIAWLAILAALIVIGIVTSLKRMSRRSE